MTDTYTLSLAEIQAFIDRAAEPLGWTRQYTNLVATTANAVSDSLNTPDLLGIGATVIEGQIEAIRTSLKQRGKSPKTAGTYASVWRRLNGLLNDWQIAIDNGTEDTFWSTFSVNFRDPRIGRRRVRRISTPPAPTGLVTSIDATQIADARTLSYEFQLSAGPATLTLPETINAADVVFVAEVMTKQFRRNEKT